MSAMDHLLSDAEIAFRDALVATLLRCVPEELRARNAADRELSRDDFVLAQKALHAEGLAVPHWPVEWGGRDWTATERFLWMHSLQTCAVPPPLPFNADMIGPVLARYGTEAQKARFLPPTAALDIWWCQGFSEPDAGSDLAALSTRAVRDGDSYVVSGQKTWTSYAQHADWMFLLVRTDPGAAKKQLGISFLLLDMASAGVTVRPIRTMDGRHEVNEVFLDAVRVPVANLVGEENRGWDVAKFLLGNERHAIAGVGLSRLRLERARALMAGGASAPGLAQRADDIEADLLALETLQLLALKGVPAGAFGAADHAASVLKIRGSEVQQATTELLLDAAQGLDPELAEDCWRAFCSMRKVSIYGGSNEVQREILARQALGI